MVAGLNLQDLCQIAATRPLAIKQQKTYRTYRNRKNIHYTNENPGVALVTGILGPGWPVRTAERTGVNKKIFDGRLYSSSTNGPFERPIRTGSVYRALLEEQSCQISFRSDLKRRSLRLFFEEVTSKRTTRRTTR